MKTCTTCKNFDYDSGKCTRKQREIDAHPVYGYKLFTGATYAFEERWPGRLLARLSGECGKEGRFHTPKD